MNVRQMIMETVAETDEELLDKYLENGELVMKIYIQG